MGTCFCLVMNVPFTVVLVMFIYGQKNLNFYEEVENNPHHVMIWTRITLHHLLGFLFFEGSVNQHSYLHMVKEWLVPERSALVILDTIILH